MGCPICAFVALPNARWRNVISTWSISTTDNLDLRVHPHFTILQEMLFNRTFHPGSVVCCLALPTEPQWMAFITISLRIYSCLWFLWLEESRVIASLVMTHYCCLLPAQVPENRAGFEREYSWSRETHTQTHTGSRLSVHHGALFYL